MNIGLACSWATVLPVEQLDVLLQADQAEAPEHHRQRRLLQLRLADAQLQGTLTEAQLIAEKQAGGGG